MTMSATEADIVIAMVFEQHQFVLEVFELCAVKILNVRNSVKLADCSMLFNLILPMCHDYTQI